jgi:hypothetical protein
VHTVRASIATPLRALASGKVPNWGTLIPEIEGSPCEPEQWSFATSNTKVAIGFSNLFWPSFIEFEGILFRESIEPIGQEFSANVADWMKRLNDDRGQVERILNHIHLIDLMIERSNPSSPEQPEQMSYLAHVLRDMWPRN